MRASTSYERLDLREHKILYSNKITHLNVQERRQLPPKKSHLCLKATH